MAIAPGVWLIDGGVMSGQLARLFYKAATRSGRGIVEIGDLYVKAQTAPNGSVQVAAGSAVVLGAEVYNQGTYWIDNVTTSTVTINPTGAASRNDLLWLRMEDPTFDGSPWSHDPAVDVCASFVVTEGVSAGTSEIPNGFTGIPLARIEIPANTTAITSAYIKDVRQMFDPRTRTEQFSLQGIWEPGTDKIGNQIVGFEQFPNGASWDIDVPEWAAQAVVSAQFGGLQYLNSGGDSNGTNHDARGLMRITFGTQTTKTTAYWQQSGGSSDLNLYTRLNPIIADTLNLPKAMRGTTQTLQVEGQGTNTYRGSLEADGWSSLVVTVLFKEVAVTDQPDRSPQ